MKKHSGLLFIALASLMMVGGCAKTAPDTAKAVVDQSVVMQVAPDTVKAAEVPPVVSQPALDIPKAILLRSKEMKPYTVREQVFKNGMDEDGFNKLLEEAISKEDDDLIDSLFAKYVSDETVEKQRYEEFALKLNLSYTDEALPFLNNQNLQEDLVKFVSDAGRYADSLSLQIFGQIKDAKTLDEAIGKLSKIDGYNVFVMGKDSVSFNAEVNRYPDSKKISAIKNVIIKEEKGIVKAELDRFSTGEELSEFYDVELGKRIQLSDLLLNLRVKKGKYSEDSVTVKRVEYINKNEIRFKYDDVYGVSIEKDDSLLTDYAKSLMAKDKGYSIRTTTNANGDRIREYHFEYFTDRFSPHSVVKIPMDLNGCSNTSKIRNRMLEIMFGHSDGDLDSLVVEGFEKGWVSESDYDREPNMLLQLGDGLVSFGFEDRERRDNSGNVFIVFDKSTGEEIAVNDLIKDKDGFMKFVNSHNLYMAGFLADSAKIKEQLRTIGPEFKNYLRHSGGMGPFPGLEVFPTSWWFAFNKMDEIVPVEFNTSTARIFLDYADIKKFIDPKYLDVMERAVKSIKKE